MYDSTLSSLICFAKDDQIDELHEKDKVPIVVGGTAYYSTSLLFRDMLPSSSPPKDGEKVGEKEVVDERLELDTETLYAELQRVDPMMATRWHPRDRRKIRRSLEIFYTTGHRQSELYAEQRAAGRLGPATVKYRTLVIWLYSDQAVLDARLDSRVDEMIQAGLFTEIQTLFDEAGNGGEIDYTRGINQSIGFKQFRKYLLTQDARDKLSGIEEMKAATRRYARKQVKWIRNKLLLQCRDAGDAVQVIVLDATDLDTWQDNVLAKSLAAVTDFLSNEKFSALEYVDPPLHPLLTPKIEQEFSRNPESWEKFECPECPTFSTSSKAGWTEHLGSHAHRSNVTKAKKRAEFESWKKRQKKLHKK